MQRISFVIIVHIIAYLSCFLKLLGSIKFVNHWLWRSACAFFQPAYAATFPALLPRPYLPGANALSSLSTDVTGIIGPGLDATIVASRGPSLAFGFDAFSFLFSSACLIPLLGSKQ